MSVDDNESSIGFLGRQEILTVLIIAVLALIPIGAIITMIIVFSQPNIIDSISQKFSFALLCLEDQNKRLRQISAIHQHQVDVDDLWMLL